MDAKTLGEVMGWSLSEARYAQLLPAYEKAMRAADITNVNRAAMFAAQLGHESVGLKYQEEIASGAAYEWRQDLGNIYAGDGVKFKGHGWIQITGRHNHTAASAWAFARGYVPSPTFFVDNPNALGSDEYCWIGPAWYWTVARPDINQLSDLQQLETVTRRINGGLNGLADRRDRYRRALSFGSRLLPGGQGPVTEKVLDYPRDQVVQDTFYNCGPASTQTILRAAGAGFHTEQELGGLLRTTTNGTDYIGYFPGVLNRFLPHARYAFRNMPNDPPSGEQKDRLWKDITNSIDSGYGVVANIVAPPSNYPRAVAPSTISPAYSGGTVYHYIAIMGHSDDGIRKVWVADSGFSPYGYWLSLDQLATLIPPKGYAYSTATPKEDELTPEQDKMLRDVHRELTQPYPSRSAYRKNDEPVDTLAGYILNIDGRIHENWVLTQAKEAGMKVTDFVKKLWGK